MIVGLDQPGIGRYLAAGAMLDFSAAPRTPVAPAPRLGADTDAVLAGELPATVAADRILAAYDGDPTILERP